ncbi:MAG TPA: hypothetical protein VFZ64_07800 [Nocardioidaceae bacterium]
MPTAPSSAEGVARQHDAVRAAADLRHLVAFRAAAVRGRARPAVGVGLGVVVTLTVLAASLPAHLPGAAGTPGPGLLRSDQVLDLLPVAYLGVLVVSLVSAAVSGGGRELLARDLAVAFPISPTTDHLGSLMMAPLNIAWLLQGWTVLAATAFAVGPQHLVAVQLPVLLWLGAATALAQVVAWAMEWLRRGRRGPWVVRSLGAVAVLTATGVVVSGEARVLLERSPTSFVLEAVLDGSTGSWLPWAGRSALLLGVAALGVVVGAFLAHALARRPVREESRLETAVHAPRTHPGSDLVALMRVDRAGVWRSVPVRRGFTVLAVLPGLVALAGGLTWSTVILLPGLVVSGAALLFGVNVWALDGRGALWRESVPVSPGLVLTARVVVMGEVLLTTAGLVLVLAAVRAGVPSPAEAAAVASVTVVVTLQVLSGSVRWSVRRPFAVDLRSARATPAPPLTMVGYSTRLAVVTTLTGMVFVAVSQAPSWTWPVVVAVPFVVTSLLRMRRTARAWRDPAVRSLVVTTVAG